MNCLWFSCKSHVATSLVLNLWWVLWHAKRVIVWTSGTNPLRTTKLITCVSWWKEAVRWSWLKVVFSVKVGVWVFMYYKGYFLESEIYFLIVIPLRKYISILLAFTHTHTHTPSLNPLKQFHDLPKEHNWNLKNQNFTCHQEGTFNFKILFREQTPVIHDFNISSWLETKMKLWEGMTFHHLSVG